MIEVLAPVVLVCWLLALLLNAFWLEASDNGTRVLVVVVGGFPEVADVVVPSVVPLTNCLL